MQHRKQLYPIFPNIQLGNNSRIHISNNFLILPITPLEQEFKISPEQLGIFKKHLSTPKFVTWIIYAYVHHHFCNFTCNWSTKFHFENMNTFPFLKLPSRVWSWRSERRCPLKNGVRQCLHHLGHATFKENQFWFVNFTLKV